MDKLPERRLIALVRDGQCHCVTECDHNTGRFVGKKAGRLLDGRTHDEFPTMTERGGDGGCQND